MATGTRGGAGKRVPRPPAASIEAVGRMLADWRIGGCSGAKFREELRPLMERSARPLGLSYAGFFSAAHRLMEMHLAEHEREKERRAAPGSGAEIAAGPEPSGRADAASPPLA